jgi:hypothetical protein
MVQGETRGIALSNIIFKAKRMENENLDMVYGLKFEYWFSYFILKDAYTWTQGATIFN